MRYQDLRLWEKLALAALLIVLAVGAAWWVIFVASIYQ